MTFLCFENLVAVWHALTTPLPSDTTVTSIDWEAYLGDWYQPYGNAFSILLPEMGGVHNQAHYKLENPTTIRLRNTQSTIFCQPNSIEGTGTIVAPGQLEIVFDTMPFFKAPYWILDLGEKVDGQYPWAIVSDPNHLFLFVLARDLETFKVLYEKHVLERLKCLGFDNFLNQPIPTV